MPEGSLIPDDDLSGRTTGARQAPVSLGLVLLAWLAMTGQELFLFLRGTPYGTPYVDQVGRYLPFAIIWNMWAALAPALPLFLWWLARWDRPVAAIAARRAQRVLLVALVLATVLDQVDHELMRFMGLHLSVSVVRTYYNVSAWTQDMVELFLRDRGGPGLPFLVLLGAAAGLGYGGARLIRRQYGPRLDTPGRTLVILTALVTLPTIVMVLWPSGNRWRRVKPALASVVSETRRRLNWGTRPEDFTALSATYQQQWLAESVDSGWAFPDTTYPLLRVPTRPAAPGAPRPRAIIYLQLETFRGWDVGFLRPDRNFTPTPFLDSLARAPASAAWLRHLSFGPETVNGLFAGHCSVKPHRRESPTAMFTGTRFRCLPEVLRAHGWTTEFITGVDPDWDFQTFWLRRWYDRLDVPHRAEEEDRDVFRRAVQRARQLGRRDAPFLLTVVSYSNHLPFRSREPALDLVTSTRPDSAIWNTMHYTDDVLREFFGALRAEPWFDSTVVVITGDHGENLGEHDGTAAQRNGWRETIWVPLLMHGSDPRLPAGMRPEVASLLDVAPTLADLAGIRDSVSWMGHSLLDPVPSTRTASGLRKSAAWADQGDWSLVVDPATGALHLYRALEDPLQRRDLAPTAPTRAADLAQRIRWDQTLVDYLLETDRVWPGPVAP